MAYRDVILADNPIAYWRLGEPSGTNAADEVGTNDLTYANTPTLGVAGALPTDVDTAVTFASASSEHATIASPTFAGAAAGASMEAWVKFTDVAVGSTRTFVRWGAQSSTVGFHWFYLNTSTNPDRFSWQYADGTLNRTSFVAWAPVIDVWYHAVIAHNYTAETVAFYVDGSLLVTNDVSAWGPPVVPAASLATFVGSYSATLHLLNGSLDEVAIYDSVLTLAQVQAHYAARNWRRVPHRTPYLQILAH